MKQIWVLNEDQEIELFHKIIASNRDFNKVIFYEIPIKKAVRLYLTRPIELCVMDPGGRAFYLEK